MKLKQNHFLTRPFEQDILVFTHGEYIECIWSEIAHMRTEEQIEFFNGELGDIKNCQVVEFSSDTLHQKIIKVKSSNPYFSITGEWMKMSKKTFTPDELLAEVKKYPQLIK